MRKLFFLLVTAVIGVAAVSADTFTYKDTQGLYYLCDNITREAVLVACQDASSGYEYQQEALVIPAILTVSSSSIGDEGSSQEDRTYKVTEIGENALKDAWAFTITFEKNSNLRVIRRRGLYGISCSGVFVLPASLKTIEDEGLYVKSSSKAKQYISGLVLPEGLESLAVSSIVLNKLQTLRFLGAVPPVCATAEGETACNPFTAIGCATPEDVDVIVPDGSFDAYRQRSGIGDYFTVFTSYAPETPTGMEETDLFGTGMQADDMSGEGQSDSAARKVIIKGQVLILRDGHRYSLLGAIEN